MCQQNTSCHFFCLVNGTGTCALFKAYVAVRWPGHPASASTTTYDACYTSWGDPRDIVKTNSPFTYSSVDHSPSYATDGYACLSPKYFVTRNLPNSSSQIDMEYVTRVQKVIFATAFPFTGMDVILSNTSDYSQGQNIGRLDVSTPEWSTYTLVTNTSAAGRYITLYQAATSYHGYAEIQVIPQP
ncbi:uncharacterized protein LOC125177781 [Hyalella azteca]|uniref:Uncharacterized protein LOC125177781 n=1 Tax=Hyalella azteca TaxID=294128 RepID=A0A979FHE2_HYAAZ|nr:uncharacterized protein LOC125177781 [Hyalella azteca]